MGRQLARKGRKNGLFSLILILTLLTGLSLLLYPTISDWWNSFHQSRAIASYVETVEELDDDAYAQLWEDAQAYNEALSQDNSRFQPSEEESVRYNELLNLSGTGIMGYVEIPSIDVALPIYTAPMRRCSRWLWAILRDPPCLWADRVPTRFFPGTVACPLPLCSLTWTSWIWGTFSSCMYWVRR